MIRGIIGKKIGMTQIFDKDGNVVPVTVIEAGPCTILRIMEEPKKKVQLGFGQVKESNVNKPLKGYFQKIGVAPVSYIKEFESENNSEYEVGKELKADVFKPGDFVDITGISKGKGFQGGMKRWNWKGGKDSHGSMHHRRVGSIGASADPSRVFRGTHMPGQMGSERTTTQSLRVMDVDVANNIILIKGAIPGYRNTFLLINRSKKKAFKSLEEKSAIVVKKRNPMKQSKSKVKAKK